MPKTKMSKADKLIEEFQYTHFRTSTGKTDEFKSFSRKFKNALKEQLGENFEIVKYNSGHFYVSGFIQNKQNGEHLYFSTSDVRHFLNEWYQSMLLRTCIGVDDYRGGNNCFASLTEINELANRLT